MADDLRETAKQRVDDKAAAVKCEKLRTLLQPASFGRYPESRNPLHAPTGHAVVIDCTDAEHAREVFTALGLIALGL